MLSVIVDDSCDPAWNLALDEALLRSWQPTHPRATEAAWQRRGPGGPPASSPPVLRVWQNAPSVVVGRFQEVADVVDLAACSRDGVRIVRRASGGGAVHLDPGTLVFTLVQGLARTPLRDRPGPAEQSGRASAVRRTAPADRCSASDPRPPAHRPPDSRSGARPDLDVLVATAVEGLGLPAAALRNGTVRAARLRTRSALLTHVAVHVTRVGPFGRCHLAAGRPHADPPALTDLGLAVSLDAVRAAVLSAIVDVHGIAAARRPDPRELRCAEQLYAVRYGDVTWNLSGGSGRAEGARRLRSGRVDEAPPPWRFPEGRLTVS